MKFGDLKIGQRFFLECHQSDGSIKKEEFIKTSKCYDSDDGEYRNAINLANGAGFYVWDSDDVE